MSDTKLTCSDHTNPELFLRYDPDTGELTRKALENRSDGWNKRFANQPAGFVNKDKNGNPRYIYVYMDGRFYAAHRLAWRLFYGSQPTGHIDHINGNGLDNRIDNLRCVTASENAKNRKIRPDNRSGVSGVVWSETHKKWFASVRDNNKQISLGAFRDFFEAVCARKSAEIRCGYHANHDRVNANTQAAPRRMTMSEIASARPFMKARSSYICWLVCACLPAMKSQSVSTTLNASMMQPHNLKSLYRHLSCLVYVRRHVSLARAC